MRAAYLHKVLPSRCSLKGLRKKGSMDVGEPAAFLGTSTGKMVEEDLFQLCTTSFMASFIQMKA